jgi:uncharacterized RDD family membrane protein YckC
MDRRDIGSWVSGPRAALEASGIEFGYRGERLGLPEYGMGSVSGFGRRAVALFIDWMTAALVATLIFPQWPYGSQPSAFATLGVFFVVKSIFTTLGGASFGQRIMGLRVLPLGRNYINPLWSLLRTFLICLVIPAVIWDRDGRGLQDKATRTVVVNTREGRRRPQ